MTHFTLGRPQHAWLRLLIWLACVAIFSSEPFAASTSAEGLKWLASTTHIPLSDAGLEMWNFALRKTMHVMVYGTLAFLAYVALTQSRVPRRISLAMLASVAICCGVASLDEYHQTLTPGRTGRPADVVLDTTAAVIAVVITFALLNRRKVSAVANSA